MRSRNYSYAVFLIAGAVAMLGGCGGKATPRTFEVRVDVSQQLRNSTVRVDLVGVNNAQQSKWDNLDLKRYWTPGNALRENADNLGMIYEMQFGGGDPATQTLSRHNDIWVDWMGKDAFWLYIIADLPAAPDNKPEKVSLNNKLWDRKTGRIDVSVQTGGVFVLTAPRENNP